MHGTKNIDAYHRRCEKSPIINEGETEPASHHAALPVYNMLYHNPNRENVV